MTNVANWKITIFFMGKLTISMAIFNSYVKLPEIYIQVLFQVLWTGTRHHNLITTIHLRRFAAHLLAFSPVTVPESMEWLLCFIPCHRPRFCTRAQKVSRVTIYSTIGTIQSTLIRVDRYIHVFLSYWITIRRLFEVFLLKQQWRILSLRMMFCARILGFPKSQHGIDCMSSSASSSSRCALPPGYELYLWMCSGAQRDPVTGLKSPYASRTKVEKRQRRYRAIRTTKQIETQEMQPGFVMFCEILTNKNLHLSSSFCGSDPQWFIDSQITFHNHFTRDDWAINWRSVSCQVLLQSLLFLVTNDASWTMGSPWFSMVCLSESRVVT